MNISEYKEYIDRLNADELVEAVRLARLCGEEKTVLEEIDIYERRQKEVAQQLNLELRQLDKILQRARNKLIKRVLDRKRKGVFLADIRRS